MLSKISSPVKSYLGFTIIELMIVLAVVGLLSMVALPAYENYFKRVDVNSAKSDIKLIGLMITDYKLSNGNHPGSLADVNMSGMVDPWGAPYQYLNHDGAKTGKKRKDKNLVPINSDYDLYSMGEDGRSVSPLTAKHSRDDIIRANNGKFVGVAEDY